MIRHAEASAILAATPAQVFAHLDDQRRLAEHMGRFSAMMGGGRMTYEFDTANGQAVGSHIRMEGKAFGLTMSVEETVAVRDPPRRKVWRTLGAPNLIVIGDYEMGFELTTTDGGAALRVWIDYAPSPRGPGRLVPWLGAIYAHWCVGRMVADGIQKFGEKRMR